MATSRRLKELCRPVEVDLKRFDTLQTKVLGNESPLIRAISKHLLFSRGKRLRPVLVFLTGKVTRFRPRHLTEAALAIEMIHTATLLHDDVVDQSDTRRGQATVNSNWNNLISVLMGDYFFAKAFTLLVKTNSPEMLGRVSQATERVSVGELRQIEEAFNFDLTEREYLSIIADKTAALFATSASAPPLLGGAPKRVVNRLASFGEDAGCAFQIADDLLDLVGDEHRTGKHLGNDLEQGKITLPLIYSFRKSQTRTRKNIIKIMENGTGKDGFVRVLDFLNDTGGIEYARKQANSLADKALSHLKPYADNRYYNHLEELATFAINRDM